MKEINRWPEDSCLDLTYEDGLMYARSEKHRKVIGSVCRSWQSFSRSRRNRLSVLSAIEGDWPVERKRLLAKARFVQMLPFVVGRISTLLPDHENTVDWETLSTSHPEAVVFARAVSYPRLRRLDLRYRNHNRPLNPNPFLDMISKFPNLTWLSYRLHASSLEPILAVTEDRLPVVLPNLQVLWYRCDGKFGFPFTHINLPSLRYLLVHLDAPVAQIPLIDLVSAYSQTIQSIVIRADKSIDENLDVKFPPWNEFSKLEELVVDKRWTIHFEALPPSHPLKRLDARHRSSETLPSFFDGMNMRELVLQKTDRTERGELEGRDDRRTIDAVQRVVITEGGSEWHSSSISSG
jgi:hypothetical protein